MTVNAPASKSSPAAGSDTAHANERLRELIEQVRGGQSGAEIAWELGIHFESFGEAVKELEVRLGALEEENLGLQEGFEKGNAEYVQLRESMNELLNLHDLSEAISTSLNSEDILDALMDLSGRVIAYESCGVFAIDESGSALQPTALRGADVEALQQRVLAQWDDGIIDWMRERRTVVIDDIESPADGDSRSFVFIPLMVRGKQIGIFVLHGQKAKDDFTLGEIEMLGVLANQTAAAIENSRLYTDLESAHERLKESQRQLLIAAKQAAIGELAGGVAHEVNNPLQIILSRVQLMIKKGQDAKTEEGLRLIENNVRRISRIIRALLGFASDNNADAERTCFQIRTPLRQAVALVRHQLETHMIAIDFDVPDELPIVCGNVGEFEQVFINLVLNAQNAMPKGGTLRVSAAVIAAGEQAPPGGEMIEIRFQDSGLGIEPEHIDRIFEPFFTTRPDDGGTGLGLAVSYRIIDTHDGAITVESEPGRGATFIIRLPAAESSLDHEVVDVGTTDSIPVT